MGELVGAQIVRFMRIHVWVDGEEFELLDTIVIECTKESTSRTLQVFTDAHHQWSNWLDSPASYTIEGYWDDREKESLKPALGSFAPAVPYAIWAVLDVDHARKQEHLVGFLFGVDGAITFALNVHLDDIELTDSAQFWTYVNTILSYTDQIEIVRLNPVGGGASTHGKVHR